MTNGTETLRKEPIIEEEAMKVSAKNLDRQGRWRNITVAFRVSPEEDALIETAVRAAGLTKQDYITRKLTDMDVVVQGNPKVYRGLKIEMTKILRELERVGTGENVCEDLLLRIDLIASIMEGLKEEADER